VSVLVTGVAGFIGFHVARALLDRGEQVVGVDSLNAYYDVRLKRARLALLEGEGFRFHLLDIADADALAAVAREAGVDRIVHLAAQAGVRYSLEAPFAYARSNLVGHLAVLEVARGLTGLRHLVYASSSSVYGANSVLPFAETDRVDTPLSLYAATKRADELMSHAYSHLFALPQTGLRFFTVYGPWGRPDMAYYAFAEAIADGRAITVYDGGVLRRDFTYIDDIVAGVIGCLDRPPKAGAPRLLNIGNSHSEPVNALISLLEEALGRRAVIEAAPRPAADVRETFASVGAIEALCGYRPATSLAQGVPRFVAWFVDWRARCGVPVLGLAKGG
jgi:UDP-glucuronate 4-epimerase